MDDEEKEIPVESAPEIEDEPADEEAELSDKERAEQYLANWQRAQADFANYKKRAEQDKIDFAKYANSNLMCSLLPIIDDLERALETIPESCDPEWAKGLELIYRKFVSELESQGLCKIDAEGEEFDPNIHQAVLHEPGEEGKVIEEMQKGYKLKDRLLRPSMVKVGKGE